MRPTSRTSQQHIYRGHGDYAVRDPVCEPNEPTRTRIPTIADTVPASWIMSREVVCARDDLDIDALVELMVNRRIGCLPIVDRDGVPIGMVTKHDLVEELLGKRCSSDPVPMSARQLMMPLAFTLDEHATIAHAAAMMTIEGIHHVPIVAESGSLIGVVSTFDVVRWLAANDGLIASGE
jgi:CBS domain-containing protein